MADADRKLDIKDRGIYPCWTNEVIRYNDLDPNGHVNNVAINSFFEDGRVAFRNDNLRDGRDDILTGFVLVSFHAEYHAQLDYPGAVEVGTAILRIGGSSYTLAQGLFAAKTCIATAEVVTVCLDRETGKSVPLSPALKDALGRLTARETS